MNASSIAGAWVQKARQDKTLEGMVHKLHHRPQYELYDLTKDPHELKNVIGDPEYKEIADKLKARLRERLAALGDSDPIATEKKIASAGHKKKKAAPQKR